MILDVCGICNFVTNNDIELFFHFFHVLIDH